MQTQGLGWPSEVFCNLSSTDLPSSHGQHRMRILIVDMKLAIAHYLVELTLGAAITMKLNGKGSWEINRISRYLRKY